MRVGRSFSFLGLALLCVPLAGCSASLTPELGSADDLPKLPSLGSLAADDVVGTPTEVYTRIARGAVSCWFGAGGPLKGNYIYHADALPESKGGGAEITIFGKDSTASPDPRALKAFQIVIKPTGGTPELGVENFKVPEPLATRLKGDVGRWAAAEEGCGEGPVTKGWDANAAHPAAPAGKKAATKN